MCGGSSGSKKSHFSEIFLSISFVVWLLRIRNVLFCLSGEMELVGGRLKVFGGRRAVELRSMPTSQNLGRPATTTADPLRGRQARKAKATASAKATATHPLHTAAKDGPPA